MAKQKNTIHRYDIDFTSELLFGLSFCAIALIFSYAKGCDVMFYAGIPMFAAVLSGMVSFGGIDRFVALQTARRLGRGRTRNALALVRGVLVLTILWGVLMFLLFYVCADRLCESLLHFPKLAPLFRAFAPSISLIGIIGALTGFLRGMKQRRLARMGIWMVTALFFALGLVCGFYWSYRGVNVGSLLRNEDMSAIYCACGIAIGLNIAVIVTLAYLALMCWLYSGRIRQRKSDRDAFLEGSEQTESRSMLRRFYVQRILPDLFAGVLSVLGLILGYCFWQGGQSSTAILTSVWGGFMGVGLPVLGLCAILCATPLSAMTVRLDRDWAKGRSEAMCARLPMVLRLSAYIGIPTSVFLFGAAKEVAALFPNLTVRGQSAAIMTIKYGCVLVFLLQTALLMVRYYRNCDAHRERLYAAAIAFFAQIVALVVMSTLLGLGIVMLVLSMDVFFVIFLIVLYAMGRQELIRGSSISWMIDDALITVCSLIAVIPVEFLNDYLVEAMAALPAFLAAAAIYAVLYIIVSILLRAADLRNVDRLPGGSLVVSLAYLIGAVSTGEDEE